MKTQGGDLIDDADGSETVIEGLDEEASAQEDHSFRAFRFGIEHRDSCPRLVAFVFAEEQELPLFAFQTNGLEFLRIMTRHALDELDERLQFCRVERDVGFGVVEIGDGLPPVGIVSVDLFADESPAPAAELDCFVIDLHLPFPIRVELLPPQELVIRDDDGIFERQRERIRAIEVLAIRAHNVVGLRIAGVDEGAVEDVTGGVHTGAFHGFVDGPAKFWRQHDGLGFNAWSDGKLLNREVLNLLFTEAVSQGELDAPGFDMNALVFAAVFGDLQELVIRDEQSHRRTFCGMFETHGDEAIQVGAGESNPTVGSAFDFDVMQDRQSGSWVDHFAKSCQSGFQFRDGECDGIHGCGG